MPFHGHIQGFQSRGSHEQFTWERERDCSRSSFDALHVPIDHGAESSIDSILLKWGQCTHLSESLKEMSIAKWKKPNESIWLHFLFESLVTRIWSGYLSRENSWKYNLRFSAISFSEQSVERTSIWLNNHASSSSSGSSLLYRSRTARAAGNHSRPLGE